MDRKAASRVVSYAANSEATLAKRIQQVWDRDAHVLHPPIDLERFVKFFRTRRRRRSPTCGRAASSPTSASTS